MYQWVGGLARHWRQIAWVGAALIGSSQAQTLSTPTQNLSCNRPFVHDRCSYQSGQIGGLTRHGIVCQAAAGANSPMVLVFHGHGGCAYQIALTTRVHDAWPQAQVVYPDGLAGVATPHDPTGEQTGWQLYPEQTGDRDVQLVDGVIDHFAALGRIDPARVHAIGHSNGSRFVGVLWAVRAQRVRSFVFNAAQAGDLFERYGGSMPARAAALTMGRNDCVVPFNAARNCDTPVANSANYQEASINLARHQLGIAEGPTPFGKRSEKGTADKELGLYVHDGAHDWPADLTDLAVRFMQRN